MRSTRHTPAFHRSLSWKVCFSWAHRSQAIAGGLTALIGLLGATVLASERPNVVLVVADDLNCYSWSDEGIDVKTPNLDGFAESALTFERAYCASPVCVPSRAAMFSGLYPHSTGAYLNGSDPWSKSDVLSEIEAMPELFKRSGYQTWGRGKLFHNPPPRARHKAMWDNDASGGGGFGPFPTKEKQLAGKFFSIQAWPGPDTDFPDVNNARLAAQFLSKEQSMPFFMVLGLWRPHNPWTAPRQFFEMYDPSSLPIPTPGYRVDDLKDVPPRGKKLSRIYGNRWDHFGDSNPEDWRRIIHGYLACTSFADWSFGQALHALDQGPNAERTIVIFTSDNGYHVGEKSHYGKSTLWERSALVPMMVRLPGRRHAGDSCREPVGLIDLYPTFVDLCQLKSPRQQLDGSSFALLCKTPQMKTERAAITTYGEGMYSVRSGKWRYINYDDGTEELYDLSKDPLELKNLSESPETASARKRLQEWIPKSWAKSLGGRNG